MSSGYVAPIQPANVVTALAAVMTDIGGIDKLTPAQRRERGLQTGESERGITYAYRGIDQIAAAAQPLFGKYGVVIVPTLVTRTVEHIELNGRPWTDHFVTVTWRIYGPGGLDDHMTACSEGIGRDNSDKGANKAITSAFKNLLLRLLCIGDPLDDTDNEKHENTAQREPRLTTVQAEAIRGAIADLPDESDRRQLRKEIADRWGTPNEILARDSKAVHEFLTGRIRDILVKVPDPSPGPVEPIEPQQLDEQVTP